MSNLKLGKKNNFEKGSFTAYACNCNCMTISCGTCNNCNYSTPESTGQFNLDYVNNTGLSDDERDISLLSARFGVKPRDLVAIFKELEDAFNIKFTKEDIMDSRFDIYNNIIDSIMKQVF